MKKLVPLLALVALALPLAACGEEDDSTRTITVYAAASLTGSFEEIAEAFENKLEEMDEVVEVRLSFGGSSDLVTQIQEGAPADVFASADTANMDKLVAADLAGAGPQDFASNTLEIAVPPGNPAGIASFEDLAGPDVNLVVCAPAVPCGAAARQAADSAGVELAPVSEEQSVTDVLAKVTTGEADAGLVYATDVRAAGDQVEGVPFAEAADVVNTYPITLVAGSKEPDVARQFMQFVFSDAGQAILAGFGFGTTRP